MNLQAGVLENINLWGFPKAKVIDFLKYRKIDLLLRIAAVYLTLWWTVLLISFAANVEVMPVPFKQYVKALLIFSTAHSGFVCIIFCPVKSSEVIDNAYHKLFWKICF